MNLIAVALMVFSSVILIVALAYVIITSRHKEKMIMLEKGLNPEIGVNERILANSLRLGFLFLGVGLGFSSALIIDEFVLQSIDNPAIYPGMIFGFGGISQIVFYKIYYNRFSNK